MKSGSGDAGEGGAGAEDIQRLQDKVLGLPLIWTRSFFIFFTVFPTISPSPIFCSICFFDFFNSVFTKNLEINSSFFIIFYFKILKNSNSTGRFS
jgi:hypothetical protein